MELQFIFYIIGQHGALRELCQLLIMYQYNACTKILWNELINFVFKNVNHTGKDIIGFELFVSASTCF